MPNFSFDPPPDVRGYGLPIVRTPANGQLRFCCVSEEMIGCPTHWFGGRTVPCEPDDCKPCAEGVSWRWHGYLAGLLAGNHRLAMFEFTAQACEVINEYKKTHGSLRGCLVTARRHRNKHNGRVLIQTQSANLGETGLPQPPDLKKILCVLWNIPLPALDETYQAKGVPNIHVPPQPDQRTEAGYKRWAMLRKLAS